MISDLILIAKKFSVPSAYGRRDGVRDFFAQYPDGVYIATDAGAPAGWEGYAVWFGGTGERYAERFMELIRDGYIVERFLRARVGGLLVFTFRCRLKMRRFGTLGKPYGGLPEPDALTFYMPNGGTISLNKTGTPIVVELEYSSDRGATWTVWQEDQDGNRSLTLTAGQRMYIRNTSTSSTGFGTSIANYYTFSSDAPTYAYGHIGSLLCKTASNASLSSYCFVRLFDGMSYLYSAPDLPFTSLAHSTYRWMFQSSGLKRCPELPFISLSNYCCYYMFAYCSNMEGGVELLPSTIDRANAYVHMFDGTAITEMIIHATSVNTSNTEDWLADVPASGDFYCPAELTIPTGTNGIPSGWTRHDI